MPARGVVARLGPRVAEAMARVVVAAVCQVDPADKGNTLIDDDQLFVVRPEYRPELWVATDLQGPVEM